MIRLIYNNKPFKILNEFDVSTSNSNITFNYIKIDFTGYTLDDMPLKYQEVQIKECEAGQNILTEGDVLFFGYVDTIKLGNMKMSEEDRELSITLLSPLKLATVRTVTAVGTFQLEDLIERVFEPLIVDGFEIAELNIPNSQITVNYIMQSVESCMNDLSYKRNIFWTIDVNKKIYINSIDFLFSKEAVKVLDNPNEEEGFLNISPTIESTDYANVINIKNARVIYDVSSSSSQSSDFEILSLPRKIKSNDVIEFNYPIVLSKQYLNMLKSESSGESITAIAPLVLTINNQQYSIYYDFETETLRYTGDFTFSDSDGEEGTIVLQRDSFFNNLITGFKWNGNDNVSITFASSATALRYSKVKFMHSQEIEKLKGIISRSGQIEKREDANEGWFTNQSLLDYARNLMVKNSNEINTVELIYDKDQELKIGDLVKINLPQFYTVGNYAVSKIRYNYVSELEQQWEITLKNSEILSSYIDIFRAKENANNEEKEDSLIISEYIVDGINETHIIEEVSENESRKQLHFYQRRK